MCEKKSLLNDAVLQNLITNAQENPLSTNTENTTFALVENGVKGLLIEHNGAQWRLGTTSNVWRNTLIHVPTVPNEEDLEALQAKGIWLVKNTNKPKVALTCCGMGSVWPGMGRALYDTFPAAREAMDRLASISDWDVLSLLDETDTEKIFRTRWHQPYLFLIEYAQASYLESLGFKADLVAGHSIGELVALGLSGAYTLEDAWRMFNIRAVMTDAMEREAEHDTGMMMVYADVDVIQQCLQEFPELLISNYNSPKQYVLSGPRDVLAQTRKILRKKKHPAMVLNVSMAFHHPHMRSRRQASLESLWSFTMHKPHLPVISCVTAAPYPTDKDGICEYIADLDENAVRWIDCVTNMWEQHDIRHFVELGPADTLCGLIGEITPKAICVSAGKRQAEVEAMRMTVARLYALGHIPGRQTHAVALDLIAQDCSAEENAWEQNTHDAKPRSPMPAHVAKILPIFAEITGHPISFFRQDMDIRLDLGIRSSRFPIILHALEQSFGIQIDFEDFLHVHTLHDFAAVVAHLRKQEIDATTGQIQKECSAEIQKECNAENEKPLAENIPIFLSRYVPKPYIVNIEEPKITPSLASTLPENTCVLVIGNAPIATLWINLFSHTIAKEFLMHASDIEHAEILLQSSLRPHIIVLALENTSKLRKKSVDTIHVLPKFYDLLEENIKYCSTCTCFVHMPISQKSLMPGDYLHNIVLGSIGGAFTFLKKNHPQAQLHSISSYDSLATSTLSSRIVTLLSKTLCKDETCAKLPTYMHISQHNIESCALQTENFASVCQELPADTFINSMHKHGVKPYGHVILIAQCVSKNIAWAKKERLQLAESLKAFAPLSCTFVWVASSVIDTQVTQELNSVGLKCYSVAYDIQRQSDVRSAMHDIVARFGRIDGLIYDTCTDFFRNAEDVFNYKISLELLLREGHAHGLRHAMALVQTREDFVSRTDNSCNAQEEQELFAENFDYIVASFFEENCKMQKIYWRCLWLPVAKKANIVAKNQLIFNVGNGFAREFFCAASGHVFWNDNVQNLCSLAPHALHLATKKDFTFAQHMHEYPYCYPVSCDILQGEAIIQRDYSAYGQSSISENGAVCMPPTHDFEVDAADILQGMQEGAIIQYPWLCSCGFMHISFVKELCESIGITFETSIKYKSLQPRNEEAQLQCLQSDMSMRSLIAPGRRQSNWEFLAKAQCVLTGSNITLEHIVQMCQKKNADSFSTTQESNPPLQQKVLSIQGALMPLKDIAEQKHSWYGLIRFSIKYLLEAIAMPQGRVSSIEYLLHMPVWPQNYSEQIFVSWHKRDTDVGVLLQARVHQENEDVLLLIHNMLVV